MRTEGELALGGEADAADAQHPGHSGSEGNWAGHWRKGPEICALFLEAPPGKVAPRPAAIQEKYSDAFPNGKEGFGPDYCNRVRTIPTGERD